MLFFIQEIICLVLEITKSTSGRTGCLPKREFDCSSSTLVLITALSFGELFFRLFVWLVSLKFGIHLCRSLWRWVPKSELLAKRALSKQKNKADWCPMWKRLAGQACQSLCQFIKSVQVIYCTVHSLVVWGNLAKALHQLLNLPYNWRWFLSSDVPWWWNYLNRINGETRSRFFHTKKQWS